MNMWKAVLWLKGGINLIFLFWLTHSSLSPNTDFLLSTGMHPEVTFSVLIAIDLAIVGLFIYRKRVQREEDHFDAVTDRPRIDRPNIHYIEPKWLKKTS